MVTALLRGSEWSLSQIGKRKDHVIDGVKYPPQQLQKFRKEWLPALPGQK